MELKIKELLTIRDSLAKLLNADVPIKISYKLSKTVNKINDELKFFDEKRVELIKKLGEPKGEEFIVKKENVEVFQKELNDLLDITFEIEFQKIKMDSLGEIKLSAVDLTNLDKFIDFDEKKK